MWQILITALLSKTLGVSLFLTHDEMYIPAEVWNVAGIECCFIGPVG